MPNAVLTRHMTLSRCPLRQPKQRGQNELLSARAPTVRMYFALYHEALVQLDRGEASEAVSSVLVVEPIVLVVEP